MPGGMNGLNWPTRCAGAIRNSPVLLTTGYSSSAQDAVRRGFEVLQKPYDLAALERALREAQAFERATPRATGRRGEGASPRRQRSADSVNG